MEEAYWKQFLTTGKVEDYLHFKGIHTIEQEMKCELEKKQVKGEGPDAGIGKCDSHCT